MPLSRRLPKRGFHSPFKQDFQVVNVESLNKLAEDGLLQNGVVTPEILSRLGIVRKATSKVKVLGTGDLTATLDVSAHAFSKSAAEKIQKAGGKFQPISAGAKQ
jgi:large subunit ribosomal protein L15